MRRSSLLPWSLFGLYVVVSAAWVILAALSSEPVTRNLPFVFLYGLFALVGALVAWRKPDNSIGWIFLWIGIAANVGNGAASYAVYTLKTDPGTLPLGNWAAWLGSFMWPAAITSILLLLVLFPTGRPQGRVDRWLLRGAVIGISILVFGFVFKPGRLDTVGVDVQNPLGLGFLSDVPGMGALIGLGGALIPVVAFGSVVNLVIRARRSQGAQRQQLRWFGYSALAMILINFVIANLANAFLPETYGWIGNVGFVVGLSFVPIGTGVAILRYRLFELDLIVNRTLVYGVLTTFLAGVYLASVFLFQRVLDPITRESDIAIAASTLAVSALFRPMRGRVQSFIDHRFYRRKYDATAVLDAFSASLRDRVNLEELSNELVGVVGVTVQPAHAGLWLRGKP